MKEEAPRDRAGVKVEGSLVRCPYCHTDVEPAADAWVACAGCMARHHGACWDERGACASCGALDRLSPERRAPPDDDAVLALLRAGRRDEAARALRLRGLDERAATVAVELAAAALGPEPSSSLGVARVALLAQALGLAVCGGLALTHAAAGVWTGLVVVLAATVTIGVSALRSRRSRGHLGAIALANLAPVVLAPILISTLNIGPDAGAPVLALLGFTATAASIVTATRLGAQARR
ncbi:MAG: hypothetical protein M9894_30030 [Planctomycetes bacterium]|nr:hypothetical protein [Planctomycetota bacterium]